jgi:hypothetical protein
MRFNSIHELRKFIDGGHAKIRDNLSSSSAKPKPSPKNKFAVAHEIETFNSKVIVSFLVKRHRLIDEDAYVPKWIIDAIRYQGILRDDSPEFMHYGGCRQEKIPSSEPERTIITIEEIRENEQ